MGFNKGVEEMLKFLLGLFIGVWIGIILVCIFQVNKINEKENEIWQQSIEIEDLKEQIDRERINKWENLIKSILISIVVN